MQRLLGQDFLPHTGPRYPNPKEPNLFPSLGYHADAYFPLYKRSRPGAPFVFSGEGIFKKKQTTIDSLPDECLFEILRRVDTTDEKSACAVVSKRWLGLLSTIRRDEIAVDSPEGDDDRDGCLKRCLKAEKATDVRLAAIAVGAGRRGGLNELSILGNNGSRVTDFGLKAVGRGCPSIKNLTLWNLTTVGDNGVVEIAEGCRLLEKLDLADCPGVTDRSLSAFAKNCPNLTSISLESCESIGNEGLRSIGENCQNLKSIMIKNCPLVEDQGIAGLLSSNSNGSPLRKLTLHGLTIGDMSLAVIGHYGIEVTTLVLAELSNVTERGYWVMGNGHGLQKLISLMINTCSDVTDLGLDSIGKGCPNLRQFCFRKSSLLTDHGVVSFVKSSQSLLILVLDGCPKVTQLGLFGMIGNSDKLMVLSLVNCSGINDFPLRLTSPMPPRDSLRHLLIRNCPGFGNASLSLLGQLCTNLDNIVLTGLNRISDLGFVSLVRNSKTGLTKLDLTGCVNITDKLVCSIVKLHGQTLQTLILDGCRPITDATLTAVAKNCVALSELDVSNTVITDSGIAALARASKLTIKILSISGCRYLSDRSVPSLKKLGDTLFGMNILQCRGLSERAIGSMVEEMYKCDILH